MTDQPEKGGSATKTDGSSENVTRTRKSHGEKAPRTRQGTNIIKADEAPPQPREESTSSPKTTTQRSAWNSGPPKDLTGNRPPQGRGRGRGRGRGTRGRGRGSQNGPGTGRGVSSPPNPGARQPICHSFADTGQCRWGNECRYSHNPTEQPAKPPPKRRESTIANASKHAQLLLPNGFKEQWESYPARGAYTPRWIEDTGKSNPHVLLAAMRKYVAIQAMAAADAVIDGKTHILSYTTSNSERRERAHVAYLNKGVNPDAQIEYMAICFGIITPSDIPRIKKASRPSDTSAANVLFLNQLYYHPNGLDSAPFGPQTVIELMVEYDCDLVIWVGHVFPDQFGTVVNEASYFKEISPDGSLSMKMKVAGGKSYQDPCMRWITDGCYDPLEGKNTRTFALPGKNGYLGWGVESFPDPTHAHAPPCMHYAMFSTAPRFGGREFTEINPEVITSIDVQHPFSLFIRDFNEDMFIAVMSGKVARRALKAVVGSRVYELPSGFLAFAQTQTTLVHNSTMGPRRWNILLTRWFNSRLDHEMLIHSGVVPPEAFRNLQDGVVVTIIIMQMRATNVASSILAMNANDALRSNTIMNNYGRKPLKGFTVSFKVVLALAVGALALYHLIKMPVLSLVPTISQLAAHFTTVLAKIRSYVPVPTTGCLSHIRQRFSSIFDLVRRLKERVVETPLVDDFYGFTAWVPTVPAVVNAGVQIVKRTATLAYESLQTGWGLSKGYASWIADRFGKTVGAVLGAAYTYFQPADYHPLPHDLNDWELAGASQWVRNASVSSTICIRGHNYKFVDSFWDYGFYPITFTLMWDFAMFLVMCYVIWKLIEWTEPWWPIRVALWSWPVMSLIHINYLRTTQFAHNLVPTLSLFDQFLQSSIPAAVWLWPAAEELALSFGPPHRYRVALIAAEVLIDLARTLLAEKKSYTQWCASSVFSIAAHCTLEEIRLAHGYGVSTLFHATFNWIALNPTEVFGTFSNLLTWGIAAYAAVGPHFR